MTLDRSLKYADYRMIALALIVSANALATDISTDPLTTYSAASSTDVKPNVLFVLDNSGSMDWDFMPDWACASYSTRNPYCANIGQNPSSTRHEHLFRNSSYNGVYYNPAVTYKPPIMIGTTGAFDTARYPSMTGMDAGTGADASTKPNWKAVKDDAYGVQSAANTTSDLQTDASKPPHVYTTIAGEYCSTPSLRNCIEAPGPTTSNGVNYKYPAKLRWCDSSSLTNCRAAFGGNFTYARAPSPRRSSFAVSSVSANATVTSIRVNSQEILPATVTAANTNTNEMAAAIAAAINRCNGSPTGNCALAGYAAVASGNTVTITAGIGAVTTPSISKTGSITVSNPNAFTSINSIPGYSLLTIITPGSTPAYAYPGTTAKATSRTDCASTLCTGNEEMINYANWWTYYKSRMQMMKTAASHAFATIDTATDIGNNTSRFRLGYMTINSTFSNFVNFDEFKTSHKNAWFTKLFSANPNGGTPLRRALATAGRLYAGKLNGTSLGSNAGTVVDPLQYSCQQNYTILSTDGFWNESDSEAVRLNGSSSVGNQDASLPRPYYDGGTPAAEQRTSRLQSARGQLQMRTMRSNGAWRSWQNVSSCQPGPAAECRYDWGTWSNASSCTINYSSGPGVWTVSQATDCQYTPWSQWSTVSSCVPVAQSAAPNYTAGTARECQPGGSGGTSNTLADVAAYYYNMDLRSDATNSETGPCTSPTTGNNLCLNNVPASGRDVATWQHMTTFTLGLGAQGRMIYAPNDDKDYWNDTTGDFYDVYKGTTANSGSGICSWQANGSCNWPTPSADSNANIDDMWHAAINGHGAYFSATDPSSLSASLTATLKAIMNVPRPGTAAAAASSNPNVSASDNYVFSSSYKSMEWYGELIRQRISEAGTLTEQNWSAMKLVDCSTTEWKPSNNYVVGDVYRQGTTCYSVIQDYTSGTTFDGTVNGVDVINTGVVNVDESAETKVPVTAPTSRTIYTKGAISGTTVLIPFDWTNLGSAGLTSYFTAPHISYVSASVGLSQFCASGGNCLSASAQSNNTIATGGAAGEALVNFLRGDRTFEGTYFRRRIHVLGDIVSSEARYVQAPLFSYNDANYGAFRTANTSRSGMVYVGANDGMLHAFDATTGRELWAYIPSMVLPGLYKLADKEYATKHQFFVDSSPETGDICPNAPGSTCSANQWKTILVGGLNRGGRGYYALDITDPAVPRLLWEFTDPNLGYTYNNPRITKLKDGTWVVLVSSGYNNADGVGRLYVLDANRGTVIRTINTGAGTAAAPSGLARISAHTPQPMTDNTATAAYGGDTLGNLWRFDINGDIGASGYEAHRVISFADDAGNPQPITVKPLEATINDKPVVFVGTGRFLGVSDINDQHTQSFYAVMDMLDQTTYGNPRASGSNFVKQTLTSTSCPADAPTSVCSPGELVRTSSNLPVDWTTNMGWFVDFLSAGERSSTDPALGLGTLLFTTITPQISTLNECGATDPAGTGSFVYALDYLTGGALAGTEGVVARNLGTSLVTRPVMIEQSDGTVRALIRSSSGASTGTDLGGTIVFIPPVKPPSGSGTRRVSWRLLSTQ